VAWAKARQRRAHQVRRARLALHPLHRFSILAGDDYGIIGPQDCRLSDEA